MMDENDFVSKSQKKREMNALQELGEALVGIDKHKLESLDLPEKLLDAILDAEKIKAHGARLRQMQYIGKLMRDVDPEPIRAQLAQWASPGTDPADKLAEKWRDRLLAEPDALNALMEAYQGLSRKEILRLTDVAKTERQKNMPPKSYRLLFRALREGIRAAGGNQ